jgi:hypothetical protein
MVVLNMSITVPRLAKGKGYKGPEFYGCFNTGMAPSIFHSRTGKYVVGPQLRCHDAMREGLTFSKKRVHGTGNQRVWIFKGRKAAVAKFIGLCEMAEAVNRDIASQHTETRRKAATGDFAAMLALGDF